MVSARSRRFASAFSGSFISPCDARRVKSSYLVGISSSCPSASTSVTSTAVPRLWRDPFFGSATNRGSGTSDQEPLGRQRPVAVPHLQVKPFLLQFPRCLGHLFRRPGPEKTA